MSHEKMSEGEHIAKTLVLALAKCPSSVQMDVLRRCADHLESGGSFADDYIAINQTRYALQMRDESTK